MVSSTVRSVSFVLIPQCSSSYQLSKKFRIVFFKNLDNSSSSDWQLYANFDMKSCKCFVENLPHKLLLSFDDNLVVKNGLELFHSHPNFLHRSVQYANTCRKTFRCFEDRKTVCKKIILLLAFCGVVKTH